MSLQKAIQEIKAFEEKQMQNRIKKEQFDERCQSMFNLVAVIKGKSLNIHEKSMIEKELKYYL